MRLVFISTLGGYAWGGSEELWFQTALTAAKANYEVHVSMMGVRPKDHRQIAMLEKVGVRVHFVGEPVYKQNLTRRVIRKLTGKKTKPQIVDRFNRIESLMPNRVLINASTVVSLCHFPDLSDWLLRTKLNFCTLIHHHVESGVLATWQGELLRTMFLKSRANYFVSWRNLEVLERQLVMKVPNIHHVVNPVNIESPELLPYPKISIPQIAIVARIECIAKGQDIVVQALADKAWENSSFVVNIYGKGPDEFHIKELINFYGLGNKVFIKGHVDNIMEIWKHNHILLLPSISEGTPISLVEAMCCGRAAVVTDVGDNARLIRDEENGFVIDGCTTRAFNNVLKRALAAQSRWEVMGVKSFDVARNMLAKNPAISFLELLSA